MTTPTTPTTMLNDMARLEYDTLRPQLTTLDRWYPAYLSNGAPCEAKYTFGRGVHAFTIFIHIRKPAKRGACTYYKNWIINSHAWTMKRTDDTGHHYEIQD